MNICFLKQSFQREIALLVLKCFFPFHVVISKLKKSKIVQNVLSAKKILGIELNKIFSSSMNSIIFCNLRQVLEWILKYFRMLTSSYK